MISIICALGPNREIGYKNQLLWSISEDMKRFKALTMGHPIIMGRLTYESIGRPLPGRKNIIVTRNPQYEAGGCVICHSLEDAVDAAESDKTGEVFVIGGGQIYEQAMPIADRLYLTLVNYEPECCDTYFPDYSQFGTIVEDRPADTQPPCRFLIYDRTLC